ncbi:mannose 6-phosphate receptor domain-containing protein [Metschnikowia bicuspidata var. bicuspidata NRRL YB-4993]|uniref:Mannose 6-phosphate receptor domain-containing protein n=1 Tax=Metschnikowia bicuspidata var. bicuspidata NRRL YB-4993 TaxID=869754 RepID=A0A1A0H7T3_9ASCO|nr:mannose 6-phosphate receptor domain-containing protein [Metschnikowia bicuspidata var. bicuspidata NRRL YB-4993]OBA19952.1 mannose 6-phosphate receptor domain-containing protein [Metschnikowia bicuspidata var. bicuspidata NRRL YB-4993]
MASRIQKRIIYIALVLFLVTGLFIVDKRPHQKQEHSKLFSSLQDMMLLDSEKDSKSDDEVELEACTTLNPTRGFIDLRGLTSHAQEGKFQAWLAKDYESGRNFTVGVCLSPVKKSVLSTAAFKDSVNASDVGAYYIDPETDKYVLMGQFSGKPVFRGKKLTMTYENGSFCDSILARDGLRIRRSTILTFTCDREMLNKAQVSYIASAQECTYMFEIRSHYACPTAAKADNLAAIWIFLLILMAALLVFFSGSLIIKSLRVLHLKGTPIPEK